jgi:pectate lyase
MCQGVAFADESRGVGGLPFTLQMEAHGQVGLTAEFDDKDSDGDEDDSCSHARLPLQRGGLTHMYSNMYSGVTTSGINVRMGGYALIEGNYFENAVNPATSRDSPVASSRASPPSREPGRDCPPSTASQSANNKLIVSPMCQ